MPNNLTSCLIAALDEFEYLKTLQESLELAFEQLDDLSEKPQQRLEFVLSAYRAEQEAHLHELETHLNNLQKLVFPPHHNTPTGK